MVQTESRKMPSSTPIHKDPIESLNDLYKWLMAPTTFLLLVAWSYLNYVTQTILNNPSLNKFYPYPIIQESLLEGPDLISFEVLVFVPTLVLFLVTYYLRPGKAWLISKTVSFAGTFFVLLHVGFIFVQEYLPVDLEGHTYWATLLALSFVLSTVLVWSCYRRYKLTILAHP
jgi:hypothetical protein